MKFQYFENATHKNEKRMMIHNNIVEIIRHCITNERYRQDVL